MTVQEADDLTRLHVQAETDALAEVNAALQACGAGEVSGDEVLLSVAWLHDAASAAAEGSDEWATGWDRMIEYAGKQGWLAADGTLVQAHIVH